MPLKRTMLTYTCLWSLADAVEQKYFSSKQTYDVEKTVRMATVGTFVVAPLIFTWLRIAEKLFPGRQASVIVRKIVMEQITFAPVAITSFYAATSALEGKSFEKFTEEWKEKYLRTFKTGLCYWPFVQALNFRFVPHYYRPMFVASASFMWSMFLCFMKETQPEKDTSNESHDASSKTN